LLLAILGERLEPRELTIFRELTNRATAPCEPVREFAGVIGRRGGKTRATGVLAAFLATCCDHRSVLAPGERGVLPVLAATKEQAQGSFNFIRGAIEASPILSDLIETESADTLRLVTMVDIAVKPASFRTIRGTTNIAVIADECAFWRSDESANPDVEIIRALRPSLLHTRGPLVSISSPYARRGYLWRMYSKHFGECGDPGVLIAQATTLTMNSEADHDWIEQQFEDDPVAAMAEFNAQFRTDVEAFINLESIEACVSPGIFERPPLSNAEYFGFVDPSGGSFDSMTLAICHRQDDVAVLDAIREVKPPFSPESVVSEFATLLRSYRVGTIRGDRYGGEWPREQFRKFGVDYLPSDKSKSEIYGSLLPLLNSRRIDLLDDKKLVAQLCGLERRTARGGRDSIDHGPNPHDDVANAAAGSLCLAVEESQQIVAVIGTFCLAGCAPRGVELLASMPPPPRWKTPVTFGTFGET
jgi:hypothetical protein